MTGAMHSSTTMTLEPIRLKPGKIQIILDTNSIFGNGKILRDFFQEIAEGNRINQENYNPIDLQNDMVCTTDGTLQRQVLTSTYFVPF